MAAPIPDRLDMRQRELPGLPLAAQYPLERSTNVPDSRNAHSPRTPSNASLDSPLLPDAPFRSHTVSPPFVSSPLNPNAPSQSSSPPPSFGAQSRQSMVFNRIASEDSQALTSHPSSPNQNRASMILYCLAEEFEQRTISPYFMNRHSVLSNSGDSTFTLSYDSKYPSGAHTPNKLIAYPFDPSLHIDTPEDDDALHDPSDNTPLPTPPGLALRGFVNITVLLLVISALLCLFIFYPVWHFVVEDKDSGP